MLVSVTIPVYNSRDGLKVSLDSLLKQTYQNWEAVIVDDGSMVSVEDIVEAYKDNRIRSHRFAVNQGRPAARQKTFMMMKGQYCAFLDAGDCFTPDYLKNAIELFLKYDNLLGVSQSMLIKYKELVFSTNYGNIEINIKDPEFDKISFASTIFRSEVCKEYVFDSKLKYSQDRQFLDYISSNYSGNIFTLNSHGYIYNQGSNMKVSTTFFKYYYDALRLFLDGKNLGSIKSLNKAICMPIVQMLFGYEKLLMMRYKKEEICVE